jgi:hypothetical protein
MGICCVEDRSNVSVARAHQADSGSFAPAESVAPCVSSSSTERWNDVPRRTMDEVSSHVRLDLPSVDGKAAPKVVPPRLRIP